METDTVPEAVEETNVAVTVKPPLAEVVTAELDSPVIEPEAGVNDIEFAEIVALAENPYPVIVTDEEDEGAMSLCDTAMEASRVNDASAVIP